ncbi:proline-rich protein 4-like [Panicum miliaceum]|uniref:Proline-rich protein 4-like n=1 Tax=Panicum miliaceum TaxID=4540 RepID=A0A3L6S6D5_PANMI|nr:proline-rich protein 4-like [Panicum miliaceum]
MGPVPRRLLAGVGAVLLVAILAHAAEPEMASMIVGLAKCADCTRKNMKAEAAFNGLKVVVKCKNADGVFETKALGEVDKSGAFSVPLTADLLREDGELKQDCFAQLHSATNQPCPGQEPSWIVRPSSDDDKKKTFVAVAGKMHYSSKECASAFLCDHFHKKHLFHKKPIMMPHFHNKPAPEHKPPTSVPVYHAPVPEYKPPTPVPVYHSPVPEYKPPTPAHSHPTPIYHPPADQKTQNPETDPEKFKKLLPFIKKNPFFFPKLPKFPPGKEEIKV